jgi:hypothetical protein
VAVGAGVGVALPARVPGATYHAAKQTLNLQQDRRYGAELVAWVEEALRTAVDVATSP